MYPIANPKTTDYNPPLNGGGIGVAGDKLLGTAEAAERLGITQRQVLKYVKSGKLPALLVGNSYVIKESDLALISKRKRRPPKTD